MSPVVRKPAVVRRLPLHLLLLSLSCLCLSCLFRGTGKRLALSEGGSREWTLLELDEELYQELGEQGRGLGVLAMASRSRVLPEAWHKPAFKQALEAWVRRGGQLLLLGYAAAYAEDLGLAGKPRIGAHVFGRRGNVDARGREFGLELSVALAKQVGHLRPGSREVVLGSGTHGRVEYCLFDEEARGDSEVLGSYYRRTEGKRQGSTLAGLLEWSLGEGTVVALGLAPLSSVEARQLIVTLASRMGQGRKGAWVALPVVAPDADFDGWVTNKPSEALPAMHEVPAGLVPRLVHYGLAATADSGSQVAARDLLPQARERGADLFLGPERGARARPSILDSDSGLHDPANRVGQVRPDAGRVRDLPVRGLIEPELSAVYPPQLFPLLHLDPDPAHGGYRDWLQVQVSDFLRSREVEASAVVLDIRRGVAKARLADLMDLLVRPLSSAHNYRLTATGTGGQRQALTRLLPPGGSLLRALSQAPCERMVIENRFLRLEGTEGSLLVDRDRAFDFSGGGASSQRLSQRFMSTRLRGARPGPGYVVKVQRKLEPKLDDSVAKDGHALRLPVSGNFLPRRISAEGTATVEKALHLPAGTYELRISVRSKGRGSLVELRLDDRAIGFLVCPGGQNDKQVFRFGIAKERTIGLVLQHRYGEAMQLLALSYEKVEDAGVETVSTPASGPRSLVVEEVGSSFLTERRSLLTLGDLPALIMEVEYDRVTAGLRVDRFFPFRGYELRGTERLERGTKVFLRLEDPTGVKPALILLASGLGRNHELAFRAHEGLAMKSYPTSQGGFRLALVLADELGSNHVDPGALWTALDEVVHPPSLAWERGERTFAWPWNFAWRRCAVLPAKAARPIQVREGGQWRGALAGSSGDRGEVLLVAGGPGEVHAVRLGDWVGPVPLPGAARLISYESDTGTLEVSRLSALCPNPGVLLRESLGSPSLDDHPWDYHYADKLWLPRLPGRYRIGLLGESTFRPSLVATTGQVQRCLYDEESHELRLEIADPRQGGRNTERLFPLVIRGPRPTGIRGAVLADPGRASPPGRILLLARPGEVRISFGDLAGPGR